MRDALDDPVSLQTEAVLRRAILERIALTDEMTVVELTRGSGVTQGVIPQHLKLLKQAEQLVTASARAWFEPNAWN